ncbi:hypothetical protein EB796_003664 [Bugula neritina]|uniref:Uncharacterized protein n=1 Tax=Bugula neritina TaxID=10212 RepID=A0A7J7KII5_BUGNE|nr:hypothetical protein EB796_003664 [Bugula neritina]
MGKIGADRHYEECFDSEENVLCCDSDSCLHQTTAAASISAKHHKIALISSNENAYDLTGDLGLKVDYRSCDESLMLMNQNLFLL